MGRQPHPTGLIRKAIILPKETWDAVAEYRYSARIPSEAESLRRLIDEALRSVVAKAKD